MGLVSLIACLEQGTRYDDIPGLVFRKQSGIVVNPGVTGPTDRVVTAADRPSPITAHYLATSGALNVQTQRGCPFRCCYCTYPLIEGRRRLERPAELVAEEFGELQRSGAKHAFIVDSVFNSSARHVREVCEALLKRDVRVSWGCFLRPQGLTAELVSLMVRAGLAHVEFGSDSFCDEVLTAYQKDFTFADITHSTELLRHQEVNACHFLIVGGPGETEVTLRTTFEHSRLLGNAVILASVGMRVYPGTPVFQRAIAENLVSPDADLLHPVYYLAPGLNRDSISDQLRQFARRSPNWMVGEPIPAYDQLVERLRKRGVVGPLWSYFSTLQRLWPQSPTDPTLS